MRPLHANRVWESKIQPGWLKPTPETPRDEKQKYISAKYVYKGFVDLQKGWEELPLEDDPAARATRLGQRLLKASAANDVSVMLQARARARRALPSHQFAVLSGPPCADAGMRRRAELASLRGWHDGAA